MQHPCSPPEHYGWELEQFGGSPCRVDVSSSWVAVSSFFQSSVVSSLSTTLVLARDMTVMLVMIKDSANKFMSTRWFMIQWFCLIARTMATTQGKIGIEYWTWLQGMWEVPWASKSWMAQIDAWWIDKEKEDCREWNPTNLGFFHQIYPNPSRLPIPLLKNPNTLHTLHSRQ